jgi:hypothetical protein
MPKDTELVSSLVSQYFERLLKERELTMGDKMLTPNYNDHDSPVDALPGP